MKSGRTYSQWIARLDGVLDVASHKTFEWGILAILVEIALILLDILFKDEA